MSPNYENWSKEDLIARLTELDIHAKAGPGHKNLYHKKRPISLTAGARPFNFKDYPRRKIAIKFCYSGWDYNGLAYQVDPTPLPTVEEVLFRAFAKARLVDPEGGMEGCGWEKCGRTDVGVSAAGQVVSLWVRSTLGANTSLPSASEAGLSELAAEPKSIPDTSPSETDNVDLDSEFPSLDLIDEPPSNSSAPPPRTSELYYVSILNRVLPPSIRILAWSPVSPTFSARFNCRYRHYKYFFTSHSLDVSLMQRAATYLIGEHDFRNLSKLDPAKQITDFHRKILKAEISRVSGQGGEVDESEDAIHVLDLVGTAFLYHQVRHIMAVLLLVGTGLESPSIVPTLMNVDGSERSPSSEPLPIVDRKPDYQMADALPLMLWDCAFSDSDVRWQTGNNNNDDDGEDDNHDQNANDDEASRETGTKGDLYQQLHSIHQRSLVHACLESYFLKAAARFHPRPPQYFPFSRTGLTTSTIPPLGDKDPVLGVPLGGGTYRKGVKYVPLLQRKRLDHVEVVNARYRNGKGGRRAERLEAANSGGADDE